MVAIEYAVPVKADKVVRSRKQNETVFVRACFDRRNTNFYQFLMNEIKRDAKSVSKLIAMIHDSFELGSSLAKGNMKKC